MLSVAEWAGGAVGGGRLSRRSVLRQLRHRSTCLGVVKNAFASEKPPGMSAKVAAGMRRWGTDTPNSGGAVTPLVVSNPDQSWRAILQLSPHCYCDPKYATNVTEKHRHAPPGRRYINC